MRPRIVLCDTEAETKTNYCETDSLRPKSGLETTLVLRIPDLNIPVETAYLLLLVLGSGTVSLKTSHLLHRCQCSDVN